MQVAATPVALTSFIGREQEVAAIRRLLESARLLTLTGAGGSGKTRLASQVADLSSGAFPDRIVWVELAPLQDAALLAGHMLAALGGEQGARSPMTALLDTMRDRAMLLVLDNCEHLVAACARLVEALLKECPRLRVLATSREALGIGGERAWLVPGLSLPAAETSVPESVANSEAVRLFVDRAQAALASFTLTATNAGAIARICRRLDGLPLAIELAAARVRSLAPEQLALRLDDSFRILTSGSRTAVPRHRTLHEAIDWSYRLLDARERLLLQRLSTFAGDFALEEAEAVTSDTELDSAEVLDTLAALVDKSLVVMRDEESTARYYLLETIRQYASDRLEESGTQALFCGRHAKTFAKMVADAAPHFITRDRPGWVAMVHRELDNVRLALACTRDHHPTEHLWLVGKLAWFWYSTGLWGEGRRWFENAIAQPQTGEPGADRAAALLGAGVLASLQAETGAAIGWLKESATLSKAIGDRSGAAYALAYMGVAYGQSGNPEALPPLEEALAWFREARDLYGERLCHVVLGTTYLVLGETSAARTHAEEGVRVAREFGLDRELAIALQVLGTVVLGLNDVERARDLFRESLEALRRDPSQYWIARALQLLGLVTCRLGEPFQGAELLGAAEACRETIGASLLAHDRDRLIPVIAAARNAIGDEAFARAWAEGRRHPLDDILAAAVEQRAKPQLGSMGDAPEVEKAGAPTPCGLEVRALGPLQILRDGAPLASHAWRYARPRELLIYLMAHPEGRTREQIGLTFWADASATQVKNNFHVTLHHVRKALGRSDLIVFDGDRYRVAWELGGGVRFDARVFEESLRPAMRVARAARARADITAALSRVRMAIELYRGDFLVDEAAGDWHIELRDHLRRLYCDALLLMGEHLMRDEQYTEAAELYSRAVAVEELHEEAHRRLMLSLTRAGDRGKALRQYERLAGLLRTDLEAEPEAETRALYDKLRRAEPV